MSAPRVIFRPYAKLLKLAIKDKVYEVPESNTLLRALQYLAPDTVPYGRFCWNEECQYCRVQFKAAGDDRVRQALSCKLMVQDGMEVVEVAAEIKYCLRE
ncbi:MAG: (2Fe-2S)-binding protein, partial [Acidobacteriaceae bacterium]|nr:(2Fe-2S)-binding protein [Acidobacteriaceae bacterium]